VFAPDGPRQRTGVRTGDGIGQQDSLSKVKRVDFNSDTPNINPPLTPHFHSNGTPYWMDSEGCFIILLISTHPKSA
jgi:hypothetical protein